MLPIVEYFKVHADSATFKHTTTGSRQAPPYNIVTPVVIERQFSNGQTDARSWGWGGIGGGSLGNLKEVDVSNRAIAQLASKLGDQSSFGATLTAELKETLGLVTGTVIRLVTAARAVKRLDFRTAASQLGLPYSERTITKVRYVKAGRKRKRIVSRRRVFELPTGRTVSKTLANGWLLYSYGVAPLMSDLYNGMDVLQRPFPDKRFTAGSSGTGIYKAIDKSSPYSITWYDRSCTVRIRCGAYVSVNNPNLWLLNNLGLINPVQWVNEAIPFSFVVDWFSNLSQVIGSMTTFAGMSVKDAWTSTNYTFKESQRRVAKPPEKAVYLPIEKEWRIYRRSASLPTPKLSFSYERPSVQRALNAISLLIGFLPK